MFVLLQTLPPKALPPAAPSPLKPSFTPRAIAEDDLLDKLGFGAWADVAVMSSLSLLLGAILTGILLLVFRRAFSSKEDMQLLYNAAEKMHFDLVKRKAMAEARVQGLTSQIAAVTINLNKVR